MEPADVTSAGSFCIEIIEIEEEQTRGHEPTQRREPLL